MSEVDHRGVGVVIANAARTRFFVQRKDQDYTPLPGGYSFFGGGCEAGEAEEEAMRRELDEELGADGARLVADAGLRRIRDDLVGPTGFSYTLFEAIVSDETLARLAESPVFEGECGAVLTVAELLDRTFVWGLDAVVAKYVEGLVSPCVRPLTDADRHAIATWRYDGDLSIYDPGAGAAQLRAPDHVALATEDGALLGYGTLGVEAQVPGGRYDAPAIDLGLGVRPDLVGAGRGAAFLRVLLDYAAAREPALTPRVTVAAANARATALVTGQGFVPTHRFTRGRDGRQFVQYERGAGAARTTDER